jgi:predicted permease
VSGTSSFVFSSRSLAKSPGFTIAVLLSLALGIGANVAIFSVVNGLLFHPAGMEAPARLVAPRVNYKKLGLDRIGLSATNFADIRSARQTFSSAALEQTDIFTLLNNGSAQPLEGAAVSWQWFDVFGRRPLLGRSFIPEEDQPGANHVVVLSYPTWRKIFGAARSILGRSIELNNTPYRIIGVMPPDFRFPFEADIWVPIGLPPSAYGPRNRFNEDYFAIARLAPGITYARAETTMLALSHRVLDQVPYARASQWSMVIQPFTDYSAGDLKLPALILLAAVGLVLLIACCNVAGLMLVRGTARSREFAIRAALGAGRLVLIRQALAETGLLSLAGTALGLAAAYWLVDGITALANVQLSSGFLIQIDGYALAFTAGVGILAALLFGLFPAWHVTRLGGNYGQLKEGGRSDTESHHRARLRSALVTGQIALAFVLLFGAGLLLRTLARLQNVNPGFNPTGVTTASISLAGNQYQDPDKQIAFLRAMLQNLSQTAGIVSAAAANIVPFAGWDPTASFAIEDQVLGPGNPGPHGSDRYVTPDYFQTLQIQLLEGRYFNDGDHKGSQPVAVIDADLARKYWPGRTPIGARIREGEKTWATIVGVVAHVKQTSLVADSGHGAYYFCLYQRPEANLFVAARGNASTVNLARALQNAVRAADPTQTVFDVKTMPERIALALGPQQFAARILTAFAIAALFLAAIGLYGVISYSVARRTREIGIRAALGARQSNIFWLVLAEAFRLLAAGLTAGTVAAAALSRFARSELFQVTPFDPETFLLTACLLAWVALLAVCIPAWRATRVEPLVALRNE